MNADEDIHRKHLMARLDPMSSMATDLITGPTVRMRFHRNVALTLQDQSRITFERTADEDPAKPFVRDVPRELVGHSYLIKHGIEPADAEE